MTRNALLKVYQIRTQNNAIQIWERKGYVLETKGGKEGYTQLQKQRSQIRLELRKHGQKPMGIETCSKLNKIRHAWKTATRYLATHAWGVKYEKANRIHRSKTQKKTIQNI